jgi:uncharacterized phage protein (TIGR01671 family)
MDLKKIRAWSITAQKMYYNISSVLCCSDGVNYPKNKLGEIEWNFFKETNGHTNNFYEILNNPDFITMLPIGLKDKNGVEIYDEDIAILKSDKLYGKEKVNITIFWDKAYFQFRFKDKIKTKNGFLIESYDSDLIYIDEIEVIGNRYENPELLKNICVECEKELFYHKNYNLYFCNNSKCKNYVYFE